MSTLIGAMTTAQLDHAVEAAAGPLDEDLRRVLADLAIDTPGCHNVHPDHETGARP
jgi:hypothetical protein